MTDDELHELHTRMGGMTDDEMARTVEMIERQLIEANPEMAYGHDPMPGLLLRPPDAAMGPGMRRLCDGWIADEDVYWAAGNYWTTCAACDAVLSIAGVDEPAAALPCQN